MSELPLDPTPGLQLLQNARNGDRAALNELLEVLRPWMKRVADQVMAPRAEFDSSDVVQDAQLLIARNIEKFEGTGLAQLCGWVRTILRNQATTLVRHGRPAERLPDGSSADQRLPAAIETPIAEIIGKETRQEVRQAISRLAQEDQDVILLSDFEDMAHQEIAKVLGISTVAARKRYQRALQRLERELEHSRDESGGQS